MYIRDQYQTQIVLGFGLKFIFNIGQNLLLFVKNSIF